MCKTKIYVKSFVIFAFLLCPFCRAGAAVYSEYWPRINWKMWEKDPFSFTTSVDLRSQNHMKNLRYFQISERFLYKHSKCLHFGVNYSYIHQRGLAKDSNWRHQHRLELEVNPILPLCKGRIDIRNRLEIRKIENNPEIHYRLRQRIRLVVPIDNGAFFKSYSFSNELFYDFFTDTFNQDRLVPISFNFALTEKIDLDVFFMMRFFIENTRWQKSAVIGTEISF